MPLIKSVSETFSTQLWIPAPVVSLLNTVICGTTIPYAGRLEPWPRQICETELLIRWDVSKLISATCGFKVRQNRPLQTDCSDLKNLAICLWSLLKYIFLLFDMWYLATISDLLRGVWGLRLEMLCMDATFGYHFVTDWLLIVIVELYGSGTYGMSKGSIPVPCISHLAQLTAVLQPMSKKNIYILCMWAELNIKKQLLFCCLACIPHDYSDAYDKSFCFI